MKHRLLQISDHALLRYLERVKGVDLEAARNEVHDVVELAGFAPGCSGVLKDGFHYPIVDGVVVTVTKKHKADIRTKRWRK